jgi:NTP pyrophosphatase (non-canonical NTP hydrolase)
VHDFKGLQRTAHLIACDKGWWDDPRTKLECIALMHSELSEAVEEIRKDKPEFYMEEEKPEGWGVELADCVIRIMDLCEYHNVNLEFLISAKMRYNETRPYKHGKKL